MAPHATTQSSNFIMMAEQGKFVDKSLALVEFLDADDEPIHLVLRPRRSGKTILLRLFRAFFEHTHPAQQQQRKELFLKNKLAITKDARFESEFGRYPVLYIDFSNVLGSTMDEFRQAFKNCVRDIARGLESSGLLKGNLEKSEHEFRDQVLAKTLDDSEWSGALFRLTSVVHELTKRPVIVLVDEYDTPTSHAVQYGYFPEVNAFCWELFSRLLKNNEHIRGALLVGILRAVKTGWLSGVNNLRVYPLGAEKYSTACLFTQEETRKLYDREAMLRGDERALPFSFEALQGWYNGYFTFDGIKLYNPWSVASALSEGKLAPFWLKSGYDHIVEGRINYMLENSASFRTKMAALSAYETIEVEIEEEMSYHSIQNMTKTELWTLMYFAGYLTNVPHHLDSGSKHEGGHSDNNSGPDGDNSNDADGDNGSDNNSGPDGDNGSDADGDNGSDSDSDNTSDAGSLTILLLCIPNSEIQTLVRRWLRTYMKKCIKARKPHTSGEALFSMAVHGPMATFAKRFGNFITDQMPARFLGSQEQVYQAFVCAWFTCAAHSVKVTPHWEVCVERDAGWGRLDLVIQQAHHENGVIKEYKRISPTKKDKKDGYGDSQCRRLTKEADNALNQVETRSYRNYVQPHVTKVFEYGIAFLGPYCAVAGRLLERKPGERWLITETYDSKADEERRSKMYSIRP